MPATIHRGNKVHSFYDQPLKPKVNMKQVISDVHDHFNNSPMFRWQWAIIDVAIIAVWILH